MWSLSTSFEFCLLTVRGVQALEVKGTPEALRQATGVATDGARTILRHPGVILRTLAQLEITQKATVLIRQASEPLEKGETGRYDRLPGLNWSARSAGRFSPTD
jgi:hypothetical protein